jgi:hypothetical protein
VGKRVIGADFGEKDRRGLTQARNLLQSCNGVTKGLKRGLDLPIEGRDRQRASSFFSDMSTTD